MRLDRDLQSVQEVRILVSRARTVAATLAALGQDELDKYCAAVAAACEQNAERLAKLAAEETGFGVWQDKVQKNLLGSRETWAHAKPQRVVGVLRTDKENGLIEIGVPVGVIAGLIPSTNPTSTTMYKAILALKSGNAIVFSPHPGAQKCIRETVAVIRAALRQVAAPEDAVQAIETVTLQATDALMRHRDVSLILATGGEAMVRAAYSSGNPAIGVGPGNGPAFIERSADIPAAVRDIIRSKTFDNGVICASEQSVVVESVSAKAVEDEFTRQGGVFLSSEDGDKLARFILRANGTMNPAIVGKSAETIAKLANILVPNGTKVLLSRQTTVDDKNPYAREKLCPLLAYYEAPGWREACEICMALLFNEGAGHTMTIHSANQEVIREFALRKPVSRLLVNTPAALGGVGATTALPPAFTLGCGAIGGSATGDNIEARHLTNIRRVAWGRGGVRNEDTGARVATETSAAFPAQVLDASTPASTPVPDYAVTADDVARITREVFARLTT
ncbi:MAG: acetaldehyde dehydrogenase (acetylating) [Oscillospiraceae bacterium]|jgi:acetaldehyde dehydrogenase (acetylating)|nr:acetaldehyde dehydrogenase (acetylating) [Oscillospiraceae bacterium]